MRIRPIGIDDPRAATHVLAGRHDTEHDPTPIRRPRHTFELPQRDVRCLGREDRDGRTAIERPAIEAISVRSVVRQQHLVAGRRAEQVCQVDVVSVPDVDAIA